MTSTPGAVGRGDVGRDQAGRGFGPGHRDIPDELKAIYSTAWELPHEVAHRHGRRPGPFIDQSQSLNLFIESPTIGKLSSMYLYAWKQGLKTTYYLRSRPATRITQTTSPAATARVPTREPLEAGVPTQARSPVRWRTPRPARPAYDRMPETR